MINYPIKKENYQKKVLNNHANRGMALEELINKSNEYYALNQIAYIHKRPTPIKVFKTTDNDKITEGVFLKPSTLDYVGVFKGRYLDFEAKETISKKGFSMHNIANHQVEAMKQIVYHQGVSFAIISFKSYNEIYLLDSSFFIDAYNNKLSIIPYEKIVENGILIKEGYHIPLDYLKAVRMAYFEK